jgi:regulator of RNase E activity RraA
MRIRKSFERPDRETLELFRDVPAANIADVSARLFGMDARISPIGKSRKILGTALTVKSSMADNFIFHKALSLAQPGDVIVVNVCGDTNYSVCGDVMYRYAESRKIAGFIVDGCVRDIDYLEENDFPVYAIGSTPRGPYKNPVGEINTDICCGGQVVHPGDIIVGDADGVVVIRKEDALAIHEKLQSVLAKEKLMGVLIDEGRWENESPILTSINAEIDRIGFEVIE